MFLVLTQGISVKKILLKIWSEEYYVFIHELGVVF